MTDTALEIADKNRQQKAQITAILAIPPFNLEEAPEAMSASDMSIVFREISDVLGAEGFIDGTVTGAVPEVEEGGEPEEAATYGNNGMADESNTAFLAMVATMKTAFTNFNTTLDTEFDAITGEEV